MSFPSPSFQRGAATPSFVHPPGHFRFESHRAPSHLGPAIEPQVFPRHSARAGLLGAVLRHGARPVMNAWSQIPAPIFPPDVAEVASSFLPNIPGSTHQQVALSHCRAEIVRAAGVGTDGEHVILYLHGGAFFTCGLNSHRRMVTRISAESDMPVLNVDYRQMPEASVTTSIADGVDGFRWLLTQGYQADRITIVGDSAGGYLAFTVARAVIDAGLGRPAAIVGISPLLEIDPAAKIAHSNSRRCQAFSPVSLTRLASTIERIDRRMGHVGSRICPIDMDLTDLPPVLMHIGSREILFHDVERMANRLLAAGIACEMQVWKDQIHVFQAAALWVPEARQAIAEIGAFVRRTVPVG